MVVFIDASQKQDMLNLHLQFLTETTHLTRSKNCNLLKWALQSPFNDR